VTRKKRILLTLDGILLWQWLQSILNTQFNQIIHLQTAYCPLSTTHRRDLWHYSVSPINALRDIFWMTQQRFINPNRKVAPTKWTDVAPKMLDLHKPKTSPLSFGTFARFGPPLYSILRYTRIQVLISISFQLDRAVIMRILSISS